MPLTQMKSGVTLKFPRSLKFSTNVKSVTECTDDAGPLALFFQDGQRQSAVRVNWMPHAPGGVNYCESDGVVVSGIFTGCVMSAYKYKGSRRVAHVHTGTDAGADKDCKDFMRDLMKEEDYVEIVHFKPFDGNADADAAVAIAKKTNFGASGCCVFGLVTPQNKCYSIFTRKVGTHEYVIERCVDKSQSKYTFA